jgi:hypothetical protein
MAEGASGDSVRLTVDGVGFLRDRELRSALIRLLGDPKSKVDTNAIEDAAEITCMPQTAQNPGLLAHSAGGLEALRTLREEIERTRRSRDCQASGA